MFVHAPALVAQLQVVPLRTSIAAEIAKSRGIAVTDINLHVASLFEDEIEIVAKYLQGHCSDNEALRKAVNELAQPRIRTPIGR